MLFCAPAVLLLCSCCSYSAHTDQRPLVGLTSLSRALLMQGFLYEWLVHGEESDALNEPAAAVRALSELDLQLCSSWGALLANPSLLDSMVHPLTYDSFIETASTEGVVVTPATLAGAVVAGCRHRLLDVRRDAMDAIRRGFLRCEDLSVQLASFDLPELTSMLQGQGHLTAEELLACFAMPSASEDEAAAAGFDGVGSRVADDFETLLKDPDIMDASRRIALFRWCTALTVLPFGGLRDHKIRLRLYGSEPDDATLPEIHTCTRELHLPNYSGVRVLTVKLLLALEHATDGFQKA